MAIWGDKTIMFPNELRYMDVDRVVNLDSSYLLFHSKPRLISIVDATCSKCIHNLINPLDSVFADLLPSTQRFYILIIPHDDSAFFMHHFYPEIRAQGQLIWDQDYYFETVNGLFTSNMHLRTFLLGPDNRILQSGNPLMDSNIIEEYKKHLSVPTYQYK